LKKNHLLIKIVGTTIGALVVFVGVYAFFLSDDEDQDFIKAVNNNVITANVLIINVTTESGSTSYSVGQSGVIFKKDAGEYYLLTALHGIPLESNAKILVLGYDQPTYGEADFETRVSLAEYYSQFPEAVVEYYDEDYDLAVISFASESEYAVLSIASEQPEYRLPVAAIGNPHKGKRNTVTTGKITSRNSVPFGDEAGKSQYNVVRHSAEISMGSSGGALLNKDMEIVGINLGGGENIFHMFVNGNAMPCDRITEFIDAWNNGNE
jgi:S1-C subfamily serine protease